MLVYLNGEFLPRARGRKSEFRREIHLAAGRDVVLSLNGERRAGARNLGRRASAIEGGHVVRPALDGIGHASVGDRLVDDLAENLEHVADLAEDTRDLRVGQSFREEPEHLSFPGREEPYVLRSGPGVPGAMVLPVGAQELCRWGRSARTPSQSRKTAPASRRAS